MPWYSEEYWEGRGAFFYGDDFFYNPYDEGSDEYLDWRNGYLDAKEDLDIFLM
jgi:hypothetical protein